MRKYLLLLSLLGVAQWLVAQDEVWSLSTDTGVTVEMAGVTAFAADAEDAATFSVLLSDGEALKNVKEVTFSKTSALSSQILGKNETVLNTAEGLFLSNLKPATEIRVYNLAGTLLCSGTSGSGSKYTLDLGNLQPGYYILTINGTAYKFERTSK